MITFRDRSVFTITMGRAEETRQLIIHQSAELFNKFGYDGCALSDIMRATNLKKGGIYNHFKNKDEIALADFDYSVQKVFKRFRDRLDREITAFGKLLATIEVYASFARDPVVSGGCPIFNTAMDSHNSHPELKKKAEEAIKMMKEYIVLKLKEGEKNHEFKCNGKKNDLATMIFITLEGAIVYSRVTKDPKSIDLAVSHLKIHLDQKITKLN